MSDALLTLLADALPGSGSIYALGFNKAASAALTKTLPRADITFINDAESLASPRDVVVAGPEWEATFAERPERTFTERLARLNAALVPGGALALLLPNLHSTAQLLVPQPQAHRAFDLEGGGYDPTRPASPGDLARSFTALGRPATNTYSIFGADQRWAVLGPEAFEIARSCDAVPRAAARAIDAGFAPDAPRVLPAGLFVRELTAGNALHTAADSFLALSGARARALYVATDSSGEVQWLDGSTRDNRWIVGGPTSDKDRPHKVPTGPSAQALLLKAIASADTAAFRDIAQRLTTWVLASSALDHRTDLDWQDAISNGDTFELALDYSGTLGSGTAPEDRRELLAQAWQHFATQIRFLEPSHPWPATLSDEELVRIWLSMSGIDEDQAAALALASKNVVSLPSENSVWTNNYTLEEAGTRIVALENEVSALHATLMERDRELAVRANVIRSLRAQVIDAARKRDLMAKANQDIKNSVAFRLATQFRRAALITRPKQLVRVAGKAADQKLKAVRRAN